MSHGSTLVVRPCLLSLCSRACLHCTATTSLGVVPWSMFDAACLPPSMPVQITTTCCPSASHGRATSLGTSGAAWARCCRAMS